MTEAIPEIEAGSVPLVPLRLEIYARERALCASMETAAQRAGYAPRCGKSTKLERMPEIRARIAFLAKDDAELLKEKRRQIEARLCAAAFGDLMECVQVDEDGKIESIDWNKIKNGPLAPTIQEFKFDPKTGEVIGWKREDAMSAIAQLRDMLGFKAVTKVAPVGADGEGPAVVETITRVIVEPRNPDSEGLPAST